MCSVVAGTMQLDSTTCLLTSLSRDGHIRVVIIMCSVVAGTMQLDSTTCPLTRVGMCILGYSHHYVFSGSWDHAAGLNNLSPY